MRFFVAAVSLVAFSVYSSDLQSFKYEKESDKIPLGSTCYDIDSQMMLDGAIDQGLKCQLNLGECRLWRDKYKSQLGEDCNKIVYEPIHQTINEKPKWEYVGMGGAAGLIVGIFMGIMVAQ